MRSLKGSQAEKNLYKTFTEECRAQTRYNLSAEEAREGEQHWITDISDETTKDEYAHARKVFKRFLGNVGGILDNLMVAAMGESDEFKEIYKEFEGTARSEGYEEITDFFKELREVEKSHNEGYMDLYGRIKSESLYSSKEPVKWVCISCEYIHEGKEAPANCPLCRSPQGYFRLLNEC